MRAALSADPAATPPQTGTARMITVEDLPVGITEIELTDPPRDITLANGLAGAKRILALVRLHTHPLGVVVLDGTIGDSWAAHLPTVWAAMDEAVREHLLADGVPEDGRPCGPAQSHRLNCVQRRTAALAAAPMISVVVATRERSESLRRCLQSLLELRYPHYEIVVVDNDPQTETTATMIGAEFSSAVRYVREDRRGLAAAHNRGVAESIGSIVAFVDDDVLVDRYWLTAIAEGFAAAEDVGCVTGLILPAELDTPAQLMLEQHGGFDKGFRLRVFDSELHRPDDPLFPFTAGRLGSGANMAFDRTVLRAIGGFDAAIGAGTYARGGDDLSAFFRVVLNHRVVYEPAAIVWHRHHREESALRNQAYGYGVGLGAFLTSALAKEPEMWPALLRRLPGGLRYAFGRRSERNRNRLDGLPAELSRLERRGLLYGPIAYGVSRWRCRASSAAAQPNRTPVP